MHIHRSWRRISKGLHIRVPYCTILLILANLTIYYFIAGSFAVSPSQFAYEKLGLELIPSKIYSLITYAFIHLWPSHLFINMTYLFIFGFIAENKIGSKRFLMLYLLIILLLGTFYGVYQRIEERITQVRYILVGSSGGIWGVIGASIVANPEVALITYFSCVCIAPAVHNFAHKIMEYKEKRIVAEKKEIVEEEKELEELVKTGNISQEKYLEKKKEIEKEKMKVLEEEKKIIITHRLERSVKSAEEVHMLGAPLGAILAFALCPRIIKEWDERANKLIRFVRNYIGKKNQKIRCLKR